MGSQNGTLTCARQCAPPVICNEHCAAAGSLHCGANCNACAGMSRRPICYQQQITNTSRGRSQ